MHEKVMEDYIINNYLNFDPVIFLETTAKNLNCEAASSHFEKTIDTIAGDTSKPYKLVNWCLNVKNNNYEILNNEETVRYWTLRNSTSLKLQNQLNKSEVSYFVSKRIGDIGASVQKKISVVSKMKRKAEVRKFENDSIIFDNESVATKLKNSAESQFATYNDLSNKQKHVVGMSLNSIIDISDDTIDSQKRHFTEEQWDIIKKTYSRKTKFDDSSYKAKLKDINKNMKKLRLDKAYILARKAELSNLNSEDENIYQIYAHIINVYRKRYSSLKNGSNNSTELDSLVKIWGEVFETLFPIKSGIICKWGESKGHHNLYKIDCRIVFLNDKNEIDLSDIEAARYMYNQKVNDDHLKLCVESKDILDYIVNNSTTFNHKTVHVYMIQICQNHCEIKRLYLCDQGLYCIDDYYDLSLPISPIEFSKKSSNWFQALFSMKSNCAKLTRYIDDDDNQKTFGDHFNRSTKKPAKAIYKDWIRDTFYPPRQESDPLIMPKKLYGGSEPTTKKQRGD